MINRTVTQQIRGRALRVLLLVSLFSLALQAQTYIVTGHTGSQTFINTSATSTFNFTVPASGTWSVLGGKFTMKDGSSTSADITLSLYAGATATGPVLTSKTLTHTAFCAQVSSCGQFDWHMFAFPSAYGLVAGAQYTITLTSPAGSGSDTYYIKPGTVYFGGGLPTVSKSFTPSSINVGQTSTLAISFLNNGGDPVTNVALTDALPTGMAVASTPNLQNPCGWTVTGATNGSTSLGISGASLASGATCTVSVNVTATQGGSLVNTTGSVSSTEAGVGNQASATLSALGVPTVTKSFASSSAIVGASNKLTINITNPNASSLSGLAIADTFPSGMVVASTPNSSNTCGGTFSPSAGAGSISLSGGSLAASSSCSLQVDVKVNSSGTYTNTTGTVSSTQTGAGSTASASLTGVAPPTMTKGFSASSAAVNSPVTLTLTITNPNGSALSGLAVSDTFPSNMVVDATPNLNNTCGGTATGTAGSGVLSLTGGSLAASSSCTVSVKVKATTGGTYNNVSGAVSSTEGGSGSTASASLTVYSGPTLAKAFASSTVPLNTSVTLTFTVTNPNGTALSGVAFSDTLPANMVVASTPNASTTCGGTLTATAGSGAISLAGGGVAGSSTCTASVDVKVTAAGSYTNTTGTLSSTEGGTGNTASASITGIAAATLAKAFATSTAPVGNSVQMTLTITNPNSVALNGLAVSDSMPSNMVVAATPNLQNTCNGTPSAVAGAGTVSLIGGSLAASSSCTLKVDVKLNSAAAYTNTTGNLSSTEGGTGTGASASITGISPASLTKSFASSTVPVGTSVQMTLSFSNANSSGLTGLAVTDTLPANMVVATTPNLANTCGGTATAVAGSSSVSLSGGTLAASSSCTVKVDVKLTSSGAYVNTTGTPTSNEGSLGSSASATLTGIAPATMTKAFDASTVPVNGSEQMILTITNPNSTGLTGLSFTDTMPANMVVAATPNVQNTCNGTPSATAGSGTVSLTGGTLAANSSCTLSLNIKVTAAGAYTNTTGALSSTEGGTGSTASASITGVAPATLTKAFAASSAALNSSVQMTLTITNPNSSALSGLSLTDTMPSNMAVAATPNVQNTCNGTVTATASSGVVSLSGGTLAASSSCTVKVDVKVTAGGNYTNTTGALSSTEGGTGSTASASLAGIAAATMTKAFAASTAPVNGSVQMTLTITNPNSSGLTGLAFTDTMPSNMVVAATPNLQNTCNGTATATAGTGVVSLSAGTLAASSSCTVKVDVKVTTAGAYTNTTGVLSSTEGGAGSTATADLTGISGPALTKSFASSTVSVNGSVQMTLTVTNPNASGLTGVAFTDTMPSGMVVAATPNVQNTCNGTVTATAASGTVSLSGGTVTASSSCTVKVDVKMTSAGAYTNTTGALTSTEGGTGSTATASITALAAPVLQKSFGSPTVALNQTVTMILALSNPNVGAALTGVSVTDNFPASMIIDDAPGVNNTCGGSLVAAPSSSSLTLTGVTLAAGGSCSVRVQVKVTQEGPVTNVATISSSNGGAGAASSAGVIGSAAVPTLGEFGLLLLGMLLLWYGYIRLRPSLNGPAE